MLFDHLRAWLHQHELTSRLLAAGDVGYFERLTEESPHRIYLPAENSLQAKDAAPLALADIQSCSRLASGSPGKLLLSSLSGLSNKSWGIKGGQRDGISTLALKEAGSEALSNSGLLGANMIFGPLVKSPTTVSDSAAELLFVAPIDGIPHVANADAMEVFILKAKSYIQANQWDEVQVACSAALSVAPNMSDAYKRVGNLYQEAGRGAEALGFYGRALLLNPEFPEVYANLGSFCARQEQWLDAENYYRKAIALRPDFVPFYKPLARILEALGRLSESTDILAQAVVLDPNATGVDHYRVGKLLLGQGDEEQAVVCFRKAVEADDSCIDACQHLAKLLEKQGDWQTATIYYRKAFEAGLTKPAFQIRASVSGIGEAGAARLISSDSVCSTQSNFASASPKVTRIPARVQALPENLSDRRVKVIRSQPKIAAVEAIAPAESVRKSDAAHGSAELSQIKDAIASFQTSLQANPNQPEVYRQLARALTQMKRIDGAAQAGFNAFELEPDWAAAEQHFNLGNTLQKQGHFQQAVICYQNAMHLNSTLSLAHEQLASLQEQQGEDSNSAVSIQTKEGVLEERFEVAFLKKPRNESKTSIYFDLQANSEVFIWMLESFLGAGIDLPNIIIIGSDSHESDLKNVKDWLRTNQKHFDGIDLLKVKDNLAKIDIAVAKVKTPFLLFLDEGVTFYPQCISQCENVLISNLDQTLVYPLTERIGEASKIVGNFTWSQQAVIGAKSTSPISLFRVSKLRRIREHFELSSDYDQYSEHRRIWHQLALMGEEGILLPKILAQQYSNSISCRSSQVKWHDIEGNIDFLSEDRIAGWAYSSSIKDPLILDLYVDGKKQESITANLYRKDVYEGIKCGFDVRLKKIFHSQISIELTLEKSTDPLFGTPKYILSNSGTVEAIQKSIQLITGGKGNFTSTEKTWLAGNFLPDLIKDIRISKKLCKSSTLEVQTCQILDGSLLSWESKDISGSVDVIVPVYKNLEVTKLCLESAINSKNNTPCRIVVINDKSPESKIWDYLKKLETLGKITLINNRENQGFVRSANCGMQVSNDRDVVLLNSDAIVNDYWLDRLRKAAYKDVNIASATPLSNHASIFSYPRIAKEVGTVPKDTSAAELDELCNRFNQSKVIDVPSMHGFCCFLKRQALRQVGLFDAEKWGKGYGEEVDWSQKAISRGWRHVAAPGVFVEHVGSQSFSQGKEVAIARALKKISSEYPDFDATVQDFICQDSLAKCRRRLDIERLKGCSQNFILFVCHEFGGGTQKHLKELCQSLARENINSILLKPGQGEWLHLSSLEETNIYIDFEAKYNCKIQQEALELLEDLKSLDIVHIHIHSTLGFYNSDFIWELPIKLNSSYDVTIHDYYMVCPRVNLVDQNGDYCGEPTGENCNVCISNNKVYSHVSAQMLYEQVGSVIPWRKYFEVRLRRARRVFAPSQDAKQRILNYFDLENVVAQTHPEEKTHTLRLSDSGQKPQLEQIISTEEAFKIAVIGAISDIKGYDALYQLALCAREYKYPIEFIVFGYTKDDQKLLDIGNIRITGKFEGVDELSKLISSYTCNVAAFLNTWPETYCYTLSEALACGLAVLAPDIGAFPERLRFAKAKKLFKLNELKQTQKMLNILIELAQTYPRAQPGSSTPNCSKYKSIISNYYELGLRI